MGAVGRTGRPPDPTIRTRLIDASWVLFLARGVGPVPIEEIARTAGVSKGTLYKYFPDKAALFDAGVRLEQQRINTARAAAAGGPGGPWIDQLRGFGLATLAFITSAPAIDFYSVLAGELRRHPDLARLFYDAGPGATRAALAELLAAGHAAGELTIADPHTAADELFGVWQGFTNFQLSLGIDVDVIRADLPRRVDDGIGLLLAAHPGPHQTQP